MQVQGPPCLPDDVENRNPKEGGRNDVVLRQPRRDASGTCSTWFSVCASSSQRIPAAVCVGLRTATPRPGFGRFKEAFDTVHRFVIVVDGEGCAEVEEEGERETHRTPMSWSEDFAPNALKNSCLFLK